MATKLEMLLELEKRGELPKDKMDMLDVLRSRGEIPSLDNETKKPEINPVASAIMSAGNTASAGALPYLAAAGPQIQELLGKATGAYAGPQQSYLPGGIKKKYQKNLDTVRNISNESMQQNPVSNLVGGIGGFLLPGSLGARAYQGVSNVALRGAPQMMQGAGFLKNLGTAANLGLRNVVGGGLASAATGQMMSNLPISDTQGRSEEAKMQALFGGVLQGGMNATGSALKGIKYASQSHYGKAANEVLHNLPFGIGKTIESVGGLFKVKGTALQESKFAADTLNAEKKYAASKASIQAEKDLAKEIADANFAQQQKVIQETKDVALQSVKTFQKAENKHIGQQFSNWFNNKAGKFFDDFQKLKGSVISKYGNPKADVTELKGEIDDILSNKFFYKKDVFGKDNIEDVFSKAVDPNRSSALKALLKIRSTLDNSNYSLAELDALRQQLQGLAGEYGKKGSQYEQIFKNLSPSVDKLFKNNLNNVGGINAVKEYELANKIYSENEAVYNALRNISTSTPEDIIKNARTNLQGSMLDKIKILHPELVNPTKDVVLNDIAQNVKNPQQLTKIIDTYGRESLENFLGKTDYSKLIQAEQNLQKAYSAKPIYNAPSSNIMNAKAVKDVVEKQPLPPYISNAVDKALAAGGMLPKGLVPTIFNLMLKMK